MNIPIRNCGNCKHWGAQPVQDVTEEQQGVCRRYPPGRFMFTIHTPKGSQVQDLTGFPMTPATWGCGEHGIEVVLQ